MYKPYTVIVNGEEVLPQGGYSSCDIAPYVRQGIGADEAVELMRMRGSIMGNLILKARWNGIPRAEVDEAIAVNPPATRIYVEARLDGTSHQQAMAQITGLHVCTAAETTTVGGLDPVLGTGEVTHITRCACGKEMWRNTIRRNWSGD